MSIAGPVGARTRTIVLRALRRFGYEVRRLPRRDTDPWAPLGIDASYVEVLEDAAFRASIAEVRTLTLLDVPRLANLWALCRMTNPVGAILEVGCYRGGGALHLSNSAPDRRLVVCDSFEGFRSLDPNLDHVFTPDMFLDTSREAVEGLFTRKNRRVEVLAGYFPESCFQVELEPVSFVHLDVDTYQATSSSLDYLSGVMADRSLIVSDDYNRHADGVNRAIDEFVNDHDEWTVLPIFPSQALLVHASWF